MARKFFLFALLVGLVEGEGSGVLTQTHGEVWPKPASVKKESNIYSISNDFKFTYTGGFCEILQSSFDRHLPYIVGNIKKLCVNRAKDSSDVSELLVTITGSDGCPSCGQFPPYEMDESYSLVVSGGQARLEAKEAWGALRGIETFTQLVYQDPDSTSGMLVNQVLITDAPRYQHRGFLIDTARHYLNLETVKSHLDAMEASKMNVLHWHIVDDQSFPYQSHVYTNLSQAGAFNPYTHIYTFGQVEEVMEYARLRGIRVMPEFDTPGHTRSWGVGYPDLLSQCIDDSGVTTFTGPLDPRLNSTYDFVTTLFKEVDELFQDEAFFLGGDEVSFTCWQSNPIYKAFMREHNLSTYDDLESFYIQKVLGIVDGLPNTRIPIVWQEVFDNGCQLSSETIVNIWKGSDSKSDGYPKEESDVTSEGFQIILSAPWYLNYISYGEDWKTYYLVEPEDFNGSSTQKALVVGGEACMWGEYVDSTNFLSRTWPRAAAVAERLWSAEDVNDVTEAEPRLNEFRCRLIQRSIQAEPLSPSYCDAEWPHA